MNLCQQSPQTDTAANRGRLELGRLGLVVAQLLLISLVLARVDMLPVSFQHVVWLATGGFVIHHWLPMHWRLPAFVTMSFAALAIVLGKSTTPGDLWQPLLGLARAGLIVAVGLVFIAVCHAKVGFWVRAGLLTVAGGVVGMFRYQLLPSGDFAVVWLLLASMFMFRVMVYLYDVSTFTKPPQPSQSLAYFFLIPNVCATLFPVIDFKTFCRSHYNEAALRIYQRGVAWMSRGIVQLLLYRVVEQLFNVTTSGVYSGKTLFAFLLTNSLLYLNVSGQFHFVAGLILLFGFNLPETNHRYFLASSFTDYWRRVNIYWKDFMLKVFYYPTYFRFRKLGEVKALILATTWVFLVTWAFHLYQTWWLKGTASVTLPDTLFWLILGLLILGNALWELKRRGKRARGFSGGSTVDALGLAVRTAGTFAAVCLLWSLWSSPSLSAWIGIWRFADRYTLAGAILTLVAVMAAKIVFDVLPARRRSTRVESGRSGSAERAAPLNGSLWWRSALLDASPLVAIYVAAHLAINGYLPDIGLPQVDERLQAQRLYDVFEAGDSMPLAAGGRELTYYQQLAGMDEANRQLREALTGQRVNMPFNGRMPVSSVSDFRLWELLPNQTLAAFETHIRTNRFGMRDRDYAEDKPEGTLRLALLGSSHTMGWGVEQELIFAERLEAKLNQRAPTEVLNFAVYGYSPLGQIAVLDKRARQFAPDVVLLVGHLPDYRFVNNSLRQIQKRGLPIADGYLRTTLQTAKVSALTHDGLADKRMRRFESDLMQWSLERLAAEVRQIGAVPVYTFLPTPAELPFTDDQRRQARGLLDTAAGAGFVVLDLSDIFDGLRPDELLTGISAHSNARAHTLIADRIYSSLVDGSVQQITAHRNAAIGNRTAPVSHVERIP